MSKGMKRTVKISLIVLLAYCLLGFLVLPRIALTVINHELQAHTSVPSRVERILFNPFRLDLQLFEIHLGEAVAVDRLRIDLQWSSLWQRALHLAVVELDGPRLDAHFAKDGRLNLANLVKPTASDESPDDSDETFPLLIDHLVLKTGRLHFLDERTAEPIEFGYDSLDLALDNIATLPGNNAEASLHASGTHGGAVAWKGQLSLLPLRSSGQLSLEGIVLQDFWPYVGERLPLRLEQGTLNLDTHYQLDLSKGTDLRLSQTHLKLAPAALSAPDGGPLLRLDSAEVTDSSLDLLQQRVQIGRLAVDHLEGWAVRDADGQLDWQKLLAAQPKPAAAPASPAPDTAPAPPADAKAWQVVVKEARLNGALLHLTDRVPQQAVTLDVGPLDLQVTGLDSAGQTPFQVGLDSVIGKQGHITANGQAQLQPPGATLKLSARDLDLRLAQAYLQPYVRLELRSGMLGAELDAALTGTDPLALHVTGRAEVSQLHTLDTLAGRDFVRWQSLRLEGIDYHHGDNLSIESVALSQPYARFILNPDGSTNLDELLVPQPAPAEPVSEPSKPLGLYIGGISIADGSANFADLTLRPNFATAIQQLNGRIGAFGNRQAQPAKVQVNGSIDRYAPVHIEGSLDPFDPLRQLDIATSFRRVQLTTLTPYSGKFAGYRIRRGRLDLDLHYRIEKGQLNAQNKLLLEQLELGERVDSPDAVDLPVRLAIALLKDSQGRISIELPVQGDLNDPQFDVMPIVWQTMRNLMLRAVQAPFKFIAGLVHGGSTQDELDQVAFAPGSADLPPQAQRKLDELAAALKQRPLLRLDIEGSSTRLGDGHLLAERRLEREYQDVYYGMLQRRGDKVPREASQLSVPEDEKTALLEGLYRSRLNTQPPDEWKGLGAQARAAKMREALIGYWSDNAGLQRRLAQQRAAAIKDYLVQQGGLADDRLYLVDVRLEDGVADQPVLTRLELNSE
jgi:uncharacterized protein involved in outer membrane biogenesis